MSRYELPKVLVVSINAWRDNTGINTLVNFFSCWDPDRVAQIYTRSALPNTHVCNNFFQISENAVLKSVLKREIQTGRVVCNEKYQKESVFTKRNADSEQKKYSFFRKHRSYLFELLREAAWKLGRWNTAELDQFIDDFDADILFLPIYAYTYMNSLQLHVIQRAKKPVVTYIADDVYSYRSEKGNLLFYLNRFFLRRSIRRVMNYNNMLLVIAPKLQKEFGELFHTETALLTKGVDFTKHPFELHENNEVIQLVYTGKTNIGRWQSLSMLAREIEKINQSGQKMFLSIYTQEELTKKVANALNIECSSKVMGGVTLQEALDIQKNADLVVFAESLSWKYRDVARLSFSTKLTDYFANGKCILAIGSEHIAPVEYLREKDAALVASTKQQIGEHLNAIVSNPQLIRLYAYKAYHCGLNYHNKELVENTFKEALIQTVQFQKT